MHNKTKVFYGGGGYDKWKVYKTLDKRGSEGHHPAAAQCEDRAAWQLAWPTAFSGEAIRQIRRRGRSRWKQDVGYHRHRVSETAMYRMKCSFGEHLKNRLTPNQQTEARIRCKILNKFTELGLPQFEWI